MLEWLGLKSVEIERREPRARARRLAPARRAGRPPSRPASASATWPSRRRALGDPGGIYAHDGGVAFVYAEPDLLVQRFPARVGEFIQKTVGAAASLERLRVGGDPAYWIEGAHGFAYRQRGNVDYEDQRIAGNTLLVERAGRRAPPHRGGHRPRPRDRDRGVAARR